MKKDIFLVVLILMIGAVGIYSYTLQQQINTYKANLLEVKIQVEECKYEQTLMKEAADEQAQNYKLRLMEANQRIQDYFKELKERRGE